MPILLLSRPRPLTPAEIRLLPKGCVATDGSAGVVARAEVDLPLAGLLGFAVAMGRAVPDAFFGVQETPPPANTGAPAPEGTIVGSAATGGAAVPVPAAPPAALAPTDDVITETDGWKLVDAGQIPQAERVFGAGNPLDAAGRDRCRRLHNSGDPEEVALGCRIARLTNWKSIVVNLRPLLKHAHPSVRRDAAEAIGALAGPSMAATVRPLLTDPDAEVKAAATAALARLGG
ncbi:MAG: HEAT repeat domain-containing protein [Pseudomonadota bacterium]|nr:HEAT repeat domain-containing protein [Pseudomonadota bacterium]